MKVLVVDDNFTSRGIFQEMLGSFLFEVSVLFDAIVQALGDEVLERSFKRLHSDMKWDVGLGIRAWAKGIVIRIAAALSDEEVGVQMTISQPFQF